MPHFPIVESYDTMLNALADAMHLMDVGILLLNRDMRVRFVNQRQIELFELSPTLLASGPTFRDLLDYAATKSWFSVPPDDLAAYLDRREQAVQAGPIPPTILDLADGRRLLFGCRVCPDGGRILSYADISHELLREAGDAKDQLRAELRFASETLEAQGAYLVSLAETADENARKVEQARLELEKEIAERCHLEAELRRLATTDGLTGALNRAAFLAMGEREMERARQNGHSLAVLMVDVDHFKSINDVYGHAGGDLALQRLVTTLRTGIRTGDLVGRLGGEEFAMALPGASLEVAYEVAERLRNRIEDVRLAFDEKTIEMTISVGLSMRQATDRSIEQTVARADAALYHAKRAGRNRVEQDLVALQG